MVLSSTGGMGKEATTPFISVMAILISEKPYLIRPNNGNDPVQTVICPDKISSIVCGIKSAQHQPLRLDMTGVAESEACLT